MYSSHWKPDDTEPPLRRRQPTADGPVTLSQMAAASSTFQSRRGSVFVEGHDLPISIEAFLADHDQLTAFFLGVADPKARHRAAKHVVQNASRAATEAGHYSAVFSALERGHALRQTLPLTSLPSSTASSASSCPSLVSIDSDNRSLGDPAPLTLHHGILALRPDMTGPSTAKTSAVFQVGSWSALAPEPKVLVHEPLELKIAETKVVEAKVAETKGAESQVTTALGVDINQSEPNIFESIRQVLGDNPAYVEHIIRAIQHLPDEKQAVLLSAHGQSIAASDLVDDNDGNGSDATVQTSRSATTGRSSKSNSDRTRKRKASQDRNGNNGDGGGSRDGSGGGSGGGGSGPGHPGRPEDKKRKTSGKRYACPYCLAFRAAIANNPRFQSCRAAVYRKNRNDLRQHLYRAHSPDAKAKAEAKAKADGPNPQDDAQYYMTHKQWKDVQEKIDDAGKKHYPLNSKEWLNNESECLLAIWDVIFPAAQFPTLSKPTSPFDSDDTEYPSLQQQGKVLLEAIYAARARMAVQAGRIASTDQYQPSHSEYMDMMSQSLAIVTNMDSALSTRIVTTPTGDLRDAATTVTSAAGNATGGVSNTGGANAPPPSDITMTGTQAPSPGASAVPPLTPALPAAPPGPGSTINIQLEGPLTDIHLRVATASHDPGQQHQVVQVIIPPGAVPRSFEQKPVNQEPVNQQPSNQQLFNMPLFNHQPFTEQLVNSSENRYMAHGPQMTANGSALLPSEIDGRLPGAFGSRPVQMNGAMATPWIPATNQPIIPNLQHSHAHDLSELQNLQLLQRATQEPRTMA
ncbi:hypothetical protein EDB81DRAFT_799301 [Dactylonectria macrodidyma]|uniref:Uncharacterized protein n=1 Tax=Dactylonectria macrodidyma TaxID=307937 RepID=A0A9P9IYZ6_9HYPO|nr:hypothetical protein EDB81DRAFT_799301 [Dactylonectria macrodidyma]